MCMGEMMDIDRKGGLGLAAVKNTLPLVYDKYARRGDAVFGAGESYVMTLCTPLEAEAAAVEAARRRQAFGEDIARDTPLNRVMGQGLERPGRSEPGERLASLFSAPSTASAPVASQS
jgi:cytochrome o ubiquinol oxidase subunit II